MFAPDHISRVRRIRQDSNKLEVALWGELSTRQVTTEYPHPADDESHDEILPSLKRAQLTTLINESGMSKRALIDIWAEADKNAPLSDQNSL
jgi:hypothetical protein